MTVIPKGSLVLVTGANGFIGSHIIDQLLQAGYNVRGTVRTEAKGQWVKEYFGKKYSNQTLELVTVPDMATKGAFDEAVKGTHGVVHVASNLSFASDPNAVIPDVVAGINGVMESAAKEPQIKRFVFTSSSTAATNPKPNTKFTIDENSWNNETVEMAWAPPPYEDSRKWAVYGASKTQAEQAMWKFMEDKKPHFVANAVLPNANFGPIISPQNQDASTAGWITTLYKDGLTAPLAGIPPQWFVNVQDTAKLHVAALIDEDVKSERVFAFADTYNWNQLLAILRKERPQRKFAEDIEDDSKDLSTVTKRPRAVELLNKNFGQSDWTPLEESVKANIAHLD